MFKLGIDVGGTFTDFILISDKGATTIHKTLSTPLDPSVGLIQGMEEMAQMLNKDFREFVSEIETIVHGTTVATNALLTRKGAKTALVTTSGFRDALEMRRGIREEQYNNHYKNVEPLVPRYLRLTVDERVNADGKVVKPLSEKKLFPLIKKIKDENVEAVAVCLMNSYLNDTNEQKVVKFLRRYLTSPIRGGLGGAFITSSFEVLPSVRFYERVSTTVVSAFVGPIVSRYLDNLTKKLEAIHFKGALLIMQSNGGVVSPDIVRKVPAVTVLSGPAAAPTAGAYYADLLGYKNCITVDMGGTSFDAALIVNNECVTSTDGSIDRHRIALPSLDIVTFGAGGGSIGWIDSGGLMQVGPQSAGALPGPVSYNRGGSQPACTDADLILGYLNPDFFAGGKIKLNKQKAENTLKDLGKKTGLSMTETAAGMYRIINSNMAQGVRMVSVERGYDPREFLFIVAGGAGPIHATEICRELEIPMFLVPNVSSIFCAAGMLLGDLKHDYIRSYFTSFKNLDRKKFQSLFNEMKEEGVKTLLSEGIKVPLDGGDLGGVFYPVLDMRYIGQYHEVHLETLWENILQFNLPAIYSAFHNEHNRQFGYSLAEERTEMELINIRLRVIGKTEKPEFLSGKKTAIPIDKALKGYRDAYIPESCSFKKIPVYNGDLPLYGAFIQGPAIIERVTTSIFVSENYDCKVDYYGSFIVYDRTVLKDGLPQKSSGISSLY